MNRSDPQRVCEWLIVGGHPVMASARLQGSLLAMSTKNESDPRPGIGAGLTAIIILTIAFIITFWLLTPYLTSLVSIPTEYGTFGDMFGSINALYSGMALGGVVIAILLQRKDLQLQFAEMRRAADAQEERLDFEKTHAKKHVALDLYNEFHSESMQLAREVADEFVKSLPGDQKQSCEIMNAFDQTRTVWRLIHFFEKWGILKQQGELDNLLAWELLGFYYKWWRDNYFRGLYDGPDIPDDWKYSFETMWLIDQ